MNNAVAQRQQVEGEKETSQEQNIKAHTYFRGRQCKRKKEQVKIPEKNLHKKVRNKCNDINFKFRVKMPMMRQNMINYSLKEVFADSLVTPILPSYLSSQYIMIHLYP